MKTLNAPERKRMLFYGLLVLCLGIWGYVLFQMGSSLHEEEESTDVPVITPTSVLRPRPAPVTTPEEIPYDSSFRDPFAVPAALFTLAKKMTGPSAPRSEPQQPAAAPAPPPLTLSGIVGETMLLHDKAGAVHIGRVGERAGAVQILEVRPDHVVIRFEGLSHTLRLAR